MKAYPRLINKYTLMRMQAIGRSGTNGQMKPEQEKENMLNP